MFNHFLGFKHFTLSSIEGLFFFPFKFYFTHSWSSCLSQEICFTQEKMISLVTDQFLAYHLRRLSAPLWGE